MLSRISVSVMLVSCAMTNSALSDDRFSDKKYIAAYEEAVGNPFDEAAKQKLKNFLPKTTTEFAPSRTRFVIEGDILATESEVDAYIASKSTASEAATDQTELIVHVANGNPAVWATGARTMRYSVISATFPNESSYLQVVKDMQDATKDWETACNSCDIDFDYISEHDSITTWEEYEPLATTDKLRFIVVYNSDASGPIASAFFPNYPWSRRIVNVFPKYFALSAGGYTARGVMRHELGHTLGYRHEHTRHIPGCNFEGSDWKPVTEYDPSSVMHYFCGGAGTKHLELSEKDKIGHAIVYNSGE